MYVFMYVCYVSLGVLCINEAFHLRNLLIGLIKITTMPLLRASNRKGNNFSNSSICMSLSVHLVVYVCVCVEVNECMSKDVFVCFAMIVERS